MAVMVGLDFETYGAVDLNKHGLHRYVNDKSFLPLIGSSRWLGTAGVVDGVDYDFIKNRKRGVNYLRDHIGSAYIVAHNAPFEQQVLLNLGLDYPCSRFIDSAVVALIAGAGPRLEAAAPQLLDMDKIEAGKQLMRLFSIPGKYQEKSGSPMFDPQVIADHPKEWVEYQDYCGIDAELGLKIVDTHLVYLTNEELAFAAATMEMNRTGWTVDVDMVEEMHRRYLENLVLTEQEFRGRTGANDLNLNSLKQLKEWCADRGIKAKSFDKNHVAALRKRIEKKASTMSVDDPKFRGYSEVVDLLCTKQVLGGSSLKKLQVILDNVITDTWHPGNHLLMDQYQHAGAGQTLRTTGRNVQMQNLKRLGDEIDDMSELQQVDIEWDNDKLAANIRQVFTSSDMYGRLIVGDFSQVESRMLAFIADETWKIDAFRRNMKLYEMMASRIYGTPYERVTKSERQAGKVGELSCGYGAAWAAVQAFAANMDIELSEGEATKLVADWRQANSNIVQFWWTLDDGLHQVVETGSQFVRVLPGGMTLILQRCATPKSLLKQQPGVQSISLLVSDHTGARLMTRFFHGCYVRGRNVCYFKPSARKTGDLWRNNYTDPKTKMLRFYELYGGKLTGILVQSLCREVFMRCLLNVHRWTQEVDNQCVLVGQFHDEIVVDWKPGAKWLVHAENQLKMWMENPDPIMDFPLKAEIKSDYRYTK